MLVENENNEWYDKDGNCDASGHYDAGGHFYAERAAHITDDLKNRIRENNT